MPILEPLLGQLTARRPKDGCDAMETLISLSRETDAVFHYFDQFAVLLDHRCEQEHS